MMTERQATRKARTFTGYHAAAILVAFFGVVIAVNLVMARFAITTFGGTVVDNSYVASQKFNSWLDEARRGKELGWTISQPERKANHILLTATNALGAPLTGATVSLRAEHPLGRLPAQELQFDEVKPGIYRSTTPLIAGRWKARVHIRQAENELGLAFEIL